MAGGLDSFDWLKDRIKKPKVVVDLSGIEELKGVRTTSDGIEIGAMTTLTEIVQPPVDQAELRLCWPRRLKLVASPQIRNQGTLAATYRRTRAAGITARAGRAIAPAATFAMPTRPTGRNREHAILRRRPLRGRESSDSAPALIALDAKFVMRTPKGERVGGRRRLLRRTRNRHHPPEHPQARRSADGDPHPGDLGGRAVLFRESADRNVWDFPLMNVASAMWCLASNIERMRIAVNGAAARPLRLKAVEEAVRGKPAECRDRRNGRQAGGAGAVPLQFNAYKIPLMRNLVKRAIGGVQEATWAAS